MKERVEEILSHEQECNSLPIKLTYLKFDSQMEYNNDYFKILYILINELFFLFIVYNSEFAFCCKEKINTLKSRGVAWDFPGGGGRYQV